MQLVINDDRFVYTDITVCRDLSPWEPSRMKTSCCYFKQKREKSTRFLQNLVHVPAVALFNPATKFAFYQWMKTNGSVSVRRVTLKLFNLSGCFLPKIILSGHNLCLCVLYGSHNYQRLFYCTALTFRHRASSI